MIGGAEGPGPRRSAGYRRALEEAGIAADPALTVSGDWSRRGGHQAMRQLVATEDPPTAVFCANDLMAIGAMDAAREHGLSIPGDLALVGYDDIEAATLVSPSLTTVVNPAYEAGQAAGRLLLDRMIGIRGRATRGRPARTARGTWVGVSDASTRWSEGGMRGA